MNVLYVQTYKLLKVLRFKKNYHEERSNARGFNMFNRNLKKDTFSPALYCLHNFYYNYALDGDQVPGAPWCLHCDTLFVYNQLDITVA